MYSKDSEIVVYLLMFTGERSPLLSLPFCHSAAACGAFSNVWEWDLFVMLHWEIAAT